MKVATSGGSPFPRKSVEDTEAIDGIETATAFYIKGQFPGQEIAYINADIYDKFSGEVTVSGVMEMRPSRNAVMTP